MTFWAMFIGLVMVPMMALSIEVGRFLIARAQISAAADAAALAAAVEINTRLFQETGIVALPSGNTQAWAQRVVNENCAGLRSLGITPRISSIVVKGNTVQVSVNANLDLLFPDFVPDIPVTEIGRAEVRVLDH
jgi:Flp pilus assembly protein TadG